MKFASVVRKNWMLLIESTTERELRKSLAYCVGKISRSNLRDSEPRELLVQIVGDCFGEEVADRADRWLERKGVSYGMPIPTFAKAVMKNL